MSNLGNITFLTAFILIFVSGCTGAQKDVSQIDLGEDKPPVVELTPAAPLSSGTEPTGDVLIDESAGEITDEGGRPEVIATPTFLLGPTYEIGSIETEWGGIKELNINRAEVSTMSVSKTGGSINIGGRFFDATGAFDALWLMFSPNGSVQQKSLNLGRELRSEIVDIAYDEEKNLYFAGNLYSSMGMPEKIFIIKYEVNGEQSIKKFNVVSDPGHSRDRAYAAVGDKDGNVYVVGETSAGSGVDQNVFLAKYSFKDDRLMTIYFGTDEDDGASGVDIDQSGNVYISGYTDGILEEGYTDQNERVDAFLAWYNPADRAIKIKQFGGKYNVARAKDVAVYEDGEGNVSVYVVGGTAGYLGVAGGRSRGMTDAFIKKFGRDLTLEWSEQWGTSLYDTANSITVDKDGYIYVTGCVSNSMEIAGEFFVLKYTAEGAMLQLRLNETEKTECAKVIASDQKNNVYVAGEIYNDPRNPLSSSGIFMVKYNSHIEMQ